MNYEQYRDAWIRQGGAMPKHVTYNEYHCVIWMTTKVGNTMMNFGKDGTNAGCALPIN